MAISISPPKNSTNKSSTLFYKEAMLISVYCPKSSMLGWIPLKAESSKFSPNTHLNPPLSTSPAAWPKSTAITTSFSVKNTSSQSCKASVRLYWLRARSTSNQLPFKMSLTSSSHKNSSTKTCISSTRNCTTTNSSPKSTTWCGNCNSWGIWEPSTIR